MQTCKRTCLIFYAVNRLVLRLELDTKIELVSNDGFVVVTVQFQAVMTKLLPKFCSSSSLDEAELSLFVLKEREVGHRNDSSALKSLKNKGFMNL